MKASTQKILHSIFGLLLVIGTLCDSCFAGLSDAEQLGQIEHDYYKCNKIVSCGDGQELTSAKSEFVKGINLMFSLVKDKQGFIRETNLFKKNHLGRCNSEICIIEELRQYIAYMNGVAMKSSTLKDFSLLPFDSLAVIEYSNLSLCQDFMAEAKKGVMSLANWYGTNGVQYAYIDLNNDGIYERYFGIVYPYKVNTPGQLYAAIVPDSDFNYKVLNGKFDKQSDYIIYPVLGRLGKSSAYKQYQFDEIYTIGGSFFIPVKLGERYYLFVADSFLGFMADRDFFENWRSYLFEIGRKDSSRICSFKQAQE